MAERKEFTCIVCPRGCALVAVPDGGSYTITGHACARGEEWGVQEAVEPLRSLTTTVRVVMPDGDDSKLRPRLPVRSRSDIPLARVLEAMEAIDAVKVRAPVKAGDVVLADLLGLGVDMLAADSLPAGEDDDGY